MAVVDDLRQALDQRIKAVESELAGLLDAKKFADSHPHAIELLRSLITSNGNDPHADEPAQNIPQTQPSTTPRRGRSRGALSLKVEEILNSASNAITTSNIVAAMNDEHFPFQTSNPQVSVNDSLRWMEERGLARIERTIGVENYWIAVRNQDGK